MNKYNFSTLWMDACVKTASAIILSACISLISCNGPANNSMLREPVESRDSGGLYGNKTVHRDPAIPASAASHTDRLIDLLIVACKRETTVSAKYEAFAAKALQEGYGRIAILFRAAAVAEKVHAGNHRAVLEAMGVNMVPVVPEYTVGTTRENLLHSIDGENYASGTMYPYFMKESDSAGNHFARTSFDYARRTEHNHRRYFEAALRAIGNNTPDSLPAGYTICPTCGSTYDAAPPKRCETCMTGSGKFLKSNTR